MIDPALATGYVGRSVFAVPEDSGNVERGAFYEVGGLKAVSLPEFGVEGGFYFKQVVAMYLSVTLRLGSQPISTLESGARSQELMKLAVKNLDWSAVEFLMLSQNVL